MHVSKANELDQIVVLLSKDREAKMATAVARIIRLSFMAAPFRLQLVVERSRQRRSFKSGLLL